MKKHETVGEFAARVLARTGVEMGTMPVRRVSGGAGGTIGHIFCACGNTYVCATGYPSHVDEDGIEYFDAFEVVIVG
jgi:hypothetical protein